MNIKDCVKGKWIVSVIGDENRGEVSVLHDENRHGKRSLGWSGPLKTIICSNRDGMDKEIWDDIVNFSQKLADKHTNMASNEDYSEIHLQIASDEMMRKMTDKIWDSISQEMLQCVCDEVDEMVLSKQNEKET